MLSGPMILLSALIASLYAALFHLVKGKTLVELPIFCAVSLIGFATGELAAGFLHLRTLTIGELHFLEASVVSLGFLFVARWLKI